MSAAAGETAGRRRVLHLCYLGIEDPLVWTQVVAYLTGLAARGHAIHLLTFDPPMDAARREEVRRELAARGITWHSRRYHKRPSLPATALDALAGALAAVRLIRRHRLDVLHARNHVPAVMALIASAVTGATMLFDLRGLMADEYADAGRWSRGGVPYRLTEWVQGAAIRRAGAMVCLTDAVRRHLLGADRAGFAEVIPCCADLEALDRGRERAAEVRAELGLGERPIMVYVGKLGGRYMDREVVEFYKATREVVGGLALLVLTQASGAELHRELARAGIAAGDYRITSARPGDVGGYLAACDVGVCFYHRRFSEIAASPTKLGEYLGAGLPVVLSAGVGDADALVRAERIGVVVGDGSPAERAVRVGELRDLLADPGLRARCRAVARGQLSLRDVGVPRYDAVYRRLGQRRAAVPIAGGRRGGSPADPQPGPGASSGGIAVGPSGYM